jgi:hypothetical protein
VRGALAVPDAADRVVTALGYTPQTTPRTEDLNPAHPHGRGSHMKPDVISGSRLGCVGGRPRLLPSVLPAAKPGLLLHLPPPGFPVPLPHSIALDGENGDENRGQRDGDDCEEGIAAHASVRPFSGPTDFISLNDAACLQVRARSMSVFFASSVLAWRDHRIASSAYSRN